ncbi:MAG: response regulator [Rhodospirillaceae bacterium]|nr:response regulator [Rhodospirillaceae bacterium]
MFTIFQRIIALNCGLVVAVGLILALVVKDFLGEKFSAQHQDYGHSIAISLSEVITKSIIERRVLDTAQSLRRVAAESDNIRFLAVTDFDGKVFAHSFEGEIPDGLATFIKQSALDKKNVLDHISSVIPEISYHSQPLISGAAGRLHIGVDTAASEAAISDTGRTILLITLVVGLLGILAAIYLSRRIAQPLSRMAGLMAGISSGSRNDIPENFDHGNSYELAALYETFRNMLGKQKAAEEQVLHLNEELETRVAERTLELAQEKRRAENYLNIAGAAILTLNDRGEITLINNKGLALLAETAGDTAGRDWFESYVCVEDRSEQRSSFFKAMRDGAPLPGSTEYSVVSKDGDVRLVAWHYSLLTDEDGRAFGLLASGEDITDFRTAETEMRAAKDEAERANMAKSDFLSNMSHELRTPMNAILGFAQLLDLDGVHPLTEDQQTSVEHILKGGQHLLGLIDQILDLAKIEAGKISLSIERVTPGDIFSECLDLAGGLAEKNGIKLVNNLSGNGRHAIRADYMRFKQVLLNLISNAIKYNREEGTVVLRNEVRPDNMFRISVNDTGFGIPQELQGELFKPFARLNFENSAIEGTGIGLALSKHLMEAMSGRIGFDSKVGQGSSFWIEFPVDDSVDSETQETRELPAHTLGQDPASSQAPAELSSAAGPLGIVYVEDNPANMRLMEQFISGISNVKLIGAHTAEWGLELSRERKPGLIIMDINLPGMDGFAALKALQDDPATKDIPVIALSADAMKSQVERGKRAGFIDYLTKPVDLKLLRNTIESILGPLESMPPATDDNVTRLRPTKHAG